MAAVSTLPNGRVLDSQRSSEREHNSWDIVRPANQDVGFSNSHVDWVALRIRLGP